MNSEPKHDIFELCEMEYASLRQEICQSIELQHRILLAGYAAAGLVFGYASAVKEGPFWPTLICIPYILLGMTALWIVECNRMVRASFYICSNLWPTLTKGHKIPIADFGWERWIRNEQTDPHRFCARQHEAQFIVAVGLPLVLSGISIVIAAYAAHLKNMHYGLFLGAGFVAFCFWPQILKHFFAISKLSNTQHPESSERQDEEELPKASN